MGDMREESALNMFRQMDLKGKAKEDTQLKTVHQNTISTIRTYDESNGTVRKFSSKSMNHSYLTNSVSDFTQRVVSMEGLLYGQRRQISAPTFANINIDSAFSVDERGRLSAYFINDQRFYALYNVRSFIL